jgi:hypothetical protein
MIYDSKVLEKIGQIKLRVEENAQVIDKLVDEIIKPYTKDLDAYVDFVRSCLKDGEHPLTDSELEDISNNMATYIYYASGMCEQLGVRDDISKALYKETYNNARLDLEKGTVDDKNTIAESKSQQEQLVSICYNRAYRTLKAKVDAAQELLGSVKKVLTKRISDQSLTRMGE